MSVWEQLARDQFDPWQVVPTQVFTPYFCLLISTVFVVASHVGCLGVTVWPWKLKMKEGVLTILIVF